ncbi:iron uptake transporter permease EfeU [Corynebacterium alimapuense]|uniref:High-affinity Fe2+/Pb2+ permease n=1 Tax=Corynebacterium alimapuense TaxID=1576874 RepID=A0A3M8K752_9CORY|nr:iron uptake transporter permease EfeU [Corynebacterium alimapuense]RNE48344.1 high-affinity Fe2+/Pb2+ permease [Corynebacterium alimapuense]
MFFAAFLIGLREGLEAALIIGILLAYVRRRGHDSARTKIWWGVGIAVVGSLLIGAALTFGRYSLSFKGQEIIGGTMSILAVAMVTWMVFWMMRIGGRLKSDLEEGADAALAAGAWGIFWIAFVSVGREGIETTIILWGWTNSPAALLGALLGILSAVGLGFGLYRGILRINLGTFFNWSGVFLIIVAAGILAYGIHDLQEAAVLPGPFSGDPIAPTHPRTGEVLTGFATYPFWGAAYPFGWAFNFEHLIEPSGVLAAFLKGTVGFVPQMTWLEVTAWAVYLLVVFPAFLRQVKANRRPRPKPASESPAGPADPATPAGPDELVPADTPAAPTSSAKPQADSSPTKI